MTPIRLMLVDDHEIVRMGLRSLFARVEEIDVVGEAESVAGAIELAARLKPDVVLMDVRLPDGTGVEACREIRAEDETIRVLFITSYDDDEAILAAVLAGADGYLLKEIDRKRLVEAVRSVAAGQTILDPVAIRAVMEDVRTRTSSGSEKEINSLSPRETEILELVAKGRTNKEIGREVGLSPKTVKNYLSNIFRKLHVTRRSQAAALISQYKNS